VPVVKIDAHINDRTFAEAVARVMRRLMKE
jgi:hypothetical protein